MKRLFSRANREYSPENPERGVKISICNDQFVPRMGREMGEHKSRWWDSRFVPFHTIPLIRVEKVYMGCIHFGVILSVYEKTLISTPMTRWFEKVDQS